MRVALNDKLIVPRRKLCYDDSGQMNIAWEAGMCFHGSI